MIEEQTFIITPHCLEGLYVSQLFNAFGFYWASKPKDNETSWGRGTEVYFSGASPKYKEEDGVRAVQKGT